MTRCAVPVLVALLAAAAVSGCTSAAPAAAPPPHGPTAVTSTAATPTRISDGPVRTAVASSCPFVTTHVVHYSMGVRLGRLTVQKAGGHVVGCRFYALQHGYLHREENLPGPHQPVVEIVTTRWSSAPGAHNGFVRLAEAGTNDTQATLGGGTVGVCFQNAFDPHDHGQDYACAVSSGRTEIVVRSVDTTGTFNTVAVTRKVLHAVQA